MKVLVTGGAGFIGSHIVDLLIESGHEVIVLDNVSSGKIENLNKKAEFVEIDLLSDQIAWNDGRSKYFEDVDTVFHAAAMPRVQPSIEDPLGSNRQNVEATLRVLNYSKINNVRRFVFCSSSSVYGDAEKLPTDELCPTCTMSPYALQKLIGEQYCKLYSKLYDLETVCLRYFNVYGERMSDDDLAYSTVVSVFNKQKEQGLPLTVNGTGEQRRDFIYVKDVARMNLIAMEHQDLGNGEVVNVGSGKNYSVNQIAENFNSEIIYKPAVLEPKETLSCVDKAKSFGWNPTVDLMDWLKFTRAQADVTFRYIPFSV